MTIDEAKKIIKSECYIADLLNLDRTRMVNTALDMAIKALEQTIPKGKWIGEESLDGSIRYMCDNCKEFEYVDYYDFCPNCGADMRESDKE